MEGCAALGDFAEHGHFALELIGVLLSEEKGPFAVFHFTYVDDVVATGNQQVNLGSGVSGGGSCPPRADIRDDLQVIVVFRCKYN